MSLKIGDVVEVTYPEDFPPELLRAHPINSGYAVVYGFDVTEVGIRRALLMQGDKVDRNGVEYLRKVVADCHERAVPTNWTVKEVAK